MWNRPSNVKASSARRGGVRRLVLRGAVAGIAALAAAFAAWQCWPTKKRSGEKVGSGEVHLIQEAAPRLPVHKAEKSPKAAAVGKAPDNAARPRVRPPQQLGEVRDGYVLLGSGLHRIRGEITNDCSLTRGKHEIFKHSAENTLAGLLSMKAGDVLVGEPDYQGAFAESLRRSMQEAIRIEETDTPEQAELKRAVMEAKDELSKAMERGEDVEKILADARRECQELARAKQMMMADVYDFVDKKAVTRQDVEIYVEAANMLLESKGIAPIDRSALVDIKLRHRLGDYDPETDEEEGEE